MYPVCPATRLSRHYAVDPSGACGGASHLPARGFPAHLERDAPQLRPQCRERALGFGVVAQLAIVSLTAETSCLRVNGLGRKLNCLWSGRLLSKALLNALGWVSG